LGAREPTTGKVSEILRDSRPTPFCLRPWPPSRYRSFLPSLFPGCSGQSPEKRQPSHSRWRAMTSMTCRSRLETCPPASAHGDTKRRLRCADTHTHSRLGDIGQFAALAPLHRVSPRPLSEFGYIIYHHLLTSSPQQTQAQGRVTTLQSYRREVHEWWLQPTPTADEERRTTNPHSDPKQTTGKQYP
jgi:hypothetical protein